MWGSLCSDQRYADLFRRMNSRAVKDQTRHPRPRLADDFECLISVVDGDTPPFLASGWRLTFGSACGGYIDQLRANVGGADSWPKPLAIFGRCNERFDHF